jgi:YbbR domain-containing protein
MILALILASFAWIVAVEAEDPTIEEPYPHPIPITPPELPQGMLTMNEFAAQVMVTIRAPRSVWDSLQVDDFTATIDLTGLGPGTYKVPVQLTSDKQPSRVILVEPDYVTLELEQRVERAVPVHVQVEGKPALGYLRRATTLVDPNEVLVSGPSTYVAQVVEAFTPVSVEDADADIEKELELQPQDSEGQTVPHVTLTPEMVNVHIPIERSSYYDTLAVKAVLEGQAALGYRVTNISVEPPDVTVFGSPNALEALPGYIETEPINVEGAQADVVVRPGLNEPSNVTVVSDQQVQVRVFIEPIESSLTMEVTPELEGLRPGLTATVSLETVEVILSGPLPMLETLEAGDVRVVLKLFDLPRGTHQLEPQVVVPAGLTAQSVNPATVQVEIFVSPTPTPGQ